MKKIFAIALALVMVLSMASAFAFVGTCGDYAYTCPTVGCGVAKAEVVQFVANNTVDGFEETTCAGVVAGQDIFYGIKVTFDDNVNAQWYEHEDTQLVVYRSNTDSDTNGGKALGQLKAMTGNKTASEVSKKVFWLKQGGTLVSAFDPKTCVFGFEAKNTRAEVCANVEYNFTGVTFGTDDDLDGDYINYGTFDVKVRKNPINMVDYIVEVKKGTDKIEVFVIGGVVKYVVVNGGDVWYYDNSYNGLKGTLNKGEVSGTKASTTADCSVIDDLMALIKLDFGYCVNADVVKNIFGWVNGDPTCVTWNADAKAIVNAECEVQVMSIPKTGDKSVLAWLF